MDHVLYVTPDADAVAIVTYTVPAASDTVALLVAAVDVGTPKVWSEAMLEAAAYFATAAILSVALVTVVLRACARRAPDEAAGPLVVPGGPDKASLLPTSSPRTVICHPA